jgi:hypothetical protein
MNPIEKMKDIDRRFPECSGLADRKDYSIFYSLLLPSPLMVIGINPGGSPVEGGYQLASRSFYENGEHEYVDMHYPLAAAMRNTLLTALGTNDVDVLRRVPKTNTFFQRSQNVDALGRGKRHEYVEMCAPFVLEMIEEVCPRAIVLEGRQARDNLVAGFKVARGRSLPITEDDGAVVYGAYRGNPHVRFFQREIADFGDRMGRIELLTLGYPSTFSRLRDWGKVLDALKQHLGPTYQPPAEPWRRVVDSHR